MYHLLLTVLSALVLGVCGSANEHASKRDIVEAEIVYLSIAPKVLIVNLVCLPTSFILKSLETKSHSIG